MATGRYTGENGIICGLSTDELVEEWSRDRRIKCFFNRLFSVSVLCFYSVICCCCPKVDSPEYVT